MNLLIKLYDFREYSLRFELFRCLLFFGVERHLSPVTEPTLLLGAYRYELIQILRITYLLSSVICALIEFHKISIKIINIRKVNKINTIYNSNNKKLN